MPHFRAPSRCSTVNFGNMAEGRPQASSQLQWLLLKNWNSFYRKNLNNSRFSAEPGNLYNKHSYKHSGALCTCLKSSFSAGADCKPQSVSL